ncbi:protein CLEC16A homolog isoform X2 [Diprion similis]|uniref:protein CLEC16A homolog isoform X2 n=1 Tax=Diprion similis TaxID=362088 RepID=UPI001EF84929|nr:protein CLEC16A homolog isoform X2 [Diprion similis]
MFRSRSWFGGGLWKPKNPHSLEHLKYLYNVLSKNHTVSENNRGLLVETLRSIAEILIWGDQNDSSVFDFFLEKNMLSFFLRIMKQKCGSYVCVQLLQTLNILFENIRNETSLYYLLSNNHVNSIIVHKFDFSDEEVMAYYISFLKTLSLKLNVHTIHFFYNEILSYNLTSKFQHTNDFPLYTEAIKFFNHTEGMVRIAVRTLTLNVYRVEDASMLTFIRDRTAAPYFSNLVWFIGNHIIELDTCVRNDADHQSQNRLSDLVAEHLDHLHYLNDILCLDIPDLNQVLTEHLLHKLLVPLYVYSLTRHKSQFFQTKEKKKHVSAVVSLFLLSQVFLIISHGPLVHTLAAIILKSNLNIIENGASQLLEDYTNVSAVEKIAFVQPQESLKKSLESLNETQSDGIVSEIQFTAADTIEKTTECELTENPPSVEPSTSSNMSKTLPRPEVLNIDTSNDTLNKIKNLNVTDEEKEQRLALESPLTPQQSSSDVQEPLANKPFLESILNALSCTENDYAALFSLCLLYALANNQGIKPEMLDWVLSPSQKTFTKNWYNEILVDRLIQIITLSCQTNTKVRLVTLDLTIKLLLQLVMSDGQSLLQDYHLAAIESAKEQSTSLLRNFYKSEDIFLDMFEDEYSELQKRPLNVEWLMMDSNILLPPTGTPMTGIEFSKRLPCGEVERARRAIRIFFLIRELSLTLNGQPETHLPLTNLATCVQVNNVLDLNNTDLISCTIVGKDGQKIRRFLVMDLIQIILVEPDTRKLGWGVAKLVGLLQDIEVTGDKDDSRCLHLTIHRPLSSSATNRVPLLSAKCILDDHIRCMAAKQRLTKGRIKARQKKMSQIARLLDIPTGIPHCPTPPNYTLLNVRQERTTGRGQKQKDHPRPMFTVNKVPGFAAQMRRDSSSRSVAGQSAANGKLSDSSPNGKMRENGLKSREHSPKLPRPRSEEIPLEDMRSRKASLGKNVTCLPIAIQERIDVAITSTTPLSDTSPVLKKSEETSFTSPQNQEEPKTRRKGQVETV